MSYDCKLLLRLFQPFKEAVIMDERKDIKSPFIPWCWEILASLSWHHSQLHLFLRNRNAVMPSHCSDISNAFRQRKHNKNNNNKYAGTTAAPLKKQVGKTSESKLNVGLGSTWKKNCSSHVTGYCLFNVRWSPYRQS